MNAQTLLTYFKTGHSEPKKPTKDFPAEAYSYDGPIDPEAVATVQLEANKKLEQQNWTVIESIEDVLDEQ